MLLWRFRRLLAQQAICLAWLPDQASSIVHLLCSFLDTVRLRGFQIWDNGNDMREQVHGMKKGRALIQIRAFASGKRAASVPSPPTPEKKRGPFQIFLIIKT